MAIWYKLVSRMISPDKMVASFLPVTTSFLMTQHSEYFKPSLMPIFIPHYYQRHWGMFTFYSLKPKSVQLARIKHN